MVKDALVDYGYSIKTSRNNYTDEGYAFYYEVKNSNYNSVTILVQGSYANNTNIKRYSDVDVSVVYRPLIPLSLERTFESFKADVYKALNKKFGFDAKRKNKSIRVEGNTYRRSIDVVPAFSVSSNIESGIQFMTDDGTKIVNYPLKQIYNENAKNKSTNYKFKKYVRIFKNIRMDMKSSKISSAKEIGSFQLESLVWNVPDEIFAKYTNLGHGVEGIINYLSSHKNLIDSYYESNGIKKLCSTYMSKYYLEQFIDDINNYFEYEAINNYTEKLPSVYCTSLLISNDGTYLDEDIELKLIIKKEDYIDYKELLLDEYDVDYLGNLYKSIEKEFKCPVISTVDQYSYFSIETPNISPVKYPFLYRETYEPSYLDEVKDSMLDVVSQLEDLYNFEKYYEGDFIILKYNFSKLMQNSNTFIQSKLLFNKENVVIDYEIKSKNNKDIIRGTIKS